MKLLVTGANGFLAQHVCLYLLNKGHQVLGISRGPARLPFVDRMEYVSLDLSDAEAVKNLAPAMGKPDAILHLAAMSKPDECLRDPAASRLHNIEATAHFLEKAAAWEAYFLYSSTDFIFGEGGPHSESDTPDPLNFYGACKWEAENLVRNSGVRQGIFRPVFIYGPVWPGLRGSFIQWVADSLRAGKTIQVVNDQWRTPTFVGDLCWGIHQLLTHQIQDCFHLAGKDVLTPYQMACTTAEVLGLPTSLILAVDSHTFPEPVRRAKKSGLQIQKAMDALGYAPHDFTAGVKASFGQP